MAFTSIYTKTNINDFADWMQINPLSFNNIDLSNCLEDYDSVCKFWNQYVYNNSAFISRESLAQALKIAEGIVESQIETFVKPTFVTNEEHSIPLYFNKSITAIQNIKSLYFVTNYKNIISFGQRRNIDIGLQEINRSDEDADGIEETVTVIISLPEANMQNGIHIYHPDHINDSRYEYRYTILNYDADDFVLTIKINFYETLLLEHIFTTQFGKIFAIDGCIEDTLFVDSVYAVFSDVSDCLPHGEIVYVDSTCKENCEEKTIAFCTKIVDKAQGIFQIIPQNVDEETGCLIENSLPCITGKPVRIRVNYYSGTNDDLIQQAVFNLTAAMLALYLCDCDCLSPILHYLQQDTAIKTKDNSFQYPFDIMSNPFGTRIGQIEAWKLIQKYLDTYYHNIS